MLRKNLTAVLVAGALALVTAGPAFAIGFIDSPSAQCRKIKGNECAISWYYLSVNAAPNYMIWLRVRIGEKLVFNTQGFFQTSMYIPGEQLGDSIRVPCGKPGSSPDPKPSPNPVTLYGNTYSYTIDARDSSGLGSANYGSVACPPK
jgi:hypothetical protein